MVVLATKCYVGGDARDRALDSLGSMIQNDIGDLDVEWDIGVRDDDFISVTVTGDDANVARNLLREEWGEVVPQHREGETYVGTLDEVEPNLWCIRGGLEIPITPELQRFLPEDRTRAGDTDADPRAVRHRPAHAAEVRRG